MRPGAACTPTISRRPRLPSAALAVALLATGCAGALKPPARAVAERAHAASSYSARLRVSLKGPDLRGRVRLLLAFRRPDELRIEVPGPTGARLVAVARGGRLTAVFPAERALFATEASAAGFEALLGVALGAEEVIDLLVGVPSPRLRSCRVRWGPEAPRKIEATLPDGGRLDATVEQVELGIALPEAAFAEPPHEGYRRVDAEEARRLWGGGARRREAAR